MYVCVCMFMRVHMCMCQGPCVVVRGHLVGVAAVLVPCESPRAGLLLSSCVASTGAGCAILLARAHDCYGSSYVQVFFKAFTLQAWQSAVFPLRLPAYLLFASTVTLSLENRDLRGCFQMFPRTLPDGATFFS